MKQVGIAGAPYSGKTTFFNALTHAGASSAGGGKANLAIVPVPDERVDVLSRLHSSRKSVYAQLKFVDVAGLAKGSGAGEGLSGQTLGTLREADALAVVVRAYGDDADPRAELSDLLLELTLADLSSLGSAADKAARKVRVGDKQAAAEVALLQRAKDVLDNGRTLRSEAWDEDELAVFRNFAPLTLKPVVVVLNVDDESAESAAPLAKELALTVHADAEGLAVPARLEAEVGGMEPEEAAELLAEFGVTAGGPPRLVGAAYRKLGPLAFLTAGGDEAGAGGVGGGC